MFRKSISHLFYCLLLFSTGTAFSQAESQDQSAQIDRVRITASVSDLQVRFVSVSVAKSIRLEVFSQVGEVVYDSGYREGSLLDWAITDQGEKALPDGLYSCLVTVKGIGGGSSHRVGILRLDAGAVSFVDAEGESEVAAKDGITVLRDHVELPLTMLAHDGDAGIVSGSGGLSFRTGDIFSGKDVEHVRLTEDGNLGIGVTEPEFKLDVAGLIRAEGIVFPDGTVMKSASGTGFLATGPIVNAPFNGTVGGVRLSSQSSSPKGVVGNKQKMLSGGGPIGPFYAFEGPSNTFYGQLTGSSTTGSNNSFFGAAAGSANTTGEKNTYVGYAAGTASTTGYENSFFGDAAGISNTSGVRNSFFGKSAGSSNTYCSHNSFFGYYAGLGNTTGWYNSFFGYESGSSNTASGSSFFGYRSGKSNTTGDDNSFFGTNAGYSNTTGDDNSFFGNFAGASNIDGDSNSFFGSLVSGSKLMHI